MSTRIDLTGQADVYSETPQFTADKTATPAVRYAISLTIEHSPSALSRVFGLIGTVFMVPALSRTNIVDDAVIDVFLEFICADPHKFDLLRRKLNQLTDTVSLRVTERPSGTVPLTETLR